MTNYNKYSTLMSVYNKESVYFLKESIDSLIKQTLKPDEIVIVKDGPLTKELNDLLDDYNKRFSSIKIINLIENVGLGLALNEGLKHCSNELVARMDSDDICLPDRCKKQVEAFNKNEALMILGMQIAEFYDTPKDIVSYRWVPTDYKEICKFARRRSPFNHPTVMYKKSKILQLGGYKDVKRKEDLELFLNALNNNFYAENLEEIGLYFRSNKDNYLRRKDRVNCMNYVKTIYKFYNLGFCRLNDLVYVSCSQLFFMLAPKKLMKFISDKYLRRKLVDEK